MDALLLPGNSKHNKDWINRLGDSLSGLFGSRLVHHYKHWENDLESIDLDFEINTVVEEVKDSDEYVVIAKSIGCVLTVKAISEGKLSPSFCLFLGLPWRLINRDCPEMASWLKESKIRIVIMQNESDPAGSSDNVGSYIENINNDLISIIKTDGNTHDYENFDLINDTIAKILHS